MYSVVFKNVGVILAAVVGGNVLAVNVQAISYSGGAGTEENPFQIGGVVDWTTLSETSEDWDKHFILINDIDFGGGDIASVAPDTDAETAFFQGTLFTGVFDGDGYMLHHGQIDRPDHDYVGLFGALGPVSEIRDLGVENVEVTGRERVGGLAGYISEGTVTSCYTTGAVLGNDNAIGGLLGDARYATVVSCHARGAVTGNRNVGGLVGYSSETSITSCYATGLVTGTYDAVGGLVGTNGFGDSVVNLCYAKGNVSGGTYVGGLVGANLSGEVTYAYAVGAVTGSAPVGGLVGDNLSGTVDHAYWNLETSGQAASDGGQGRTTDGMTYPYAENTYVFWHFITVWAADTDYSVNDGYPYLAGNVPPPEEGEGEIPHPADLDVDWRMVMSEAIAYLAGWQQGSNPLDYAIRAAYLWQNGEYYQYDFGEVPPLCWVPANAETEGESEINPWQNPVNPLDVNDDGIVSPVDVLILTNDINANGSRTLPNPPVSPPPPPPYFDVNGDGALMPNDILMVVNYLNTNP